MSLLNSHTARVHLALLTVSAIYGMFYVAVKFLLQEMAQSELILMRFALTAVIVGVIEWLFLKGKPPKDFPTFLKVFGLGMVGVFLVQVFLVMGVHKTTAFHSALIMATIPMWTLGFSLLARREAFHWKKGAGILLSFSGVLLLLFSKNPATLLPSTYLEGDLLVLLAALCFAGFLLASQSLLKHFSSFSLMAYCYMFSGLAFLLAFVGEKVIQSQGQFNMDNWFAFIGHLSPQSWLLMVYIVLFASIITYTLNNYALRRMAPSVVSVYMFIQPVLSAVLGFYWLQEAFNLQMAVATAVTFGGVMLATSANQGQVIEQDFAP